MTIGSLADSKQILHSNIKLCNILVHILARLQTSMNQGQVQFSKGEVKRIYMERIEEFETEDEVFQNRLSLRKYLRELVLNQKRVIYQLFDKQGGGESSGNSVVDLLNQQKQKEIKKAERQKMEAEVKVEAQSQNTQVPKQDLSSPEERKGPSNGEVEQEPKQKAFI